MLSPLRPSWSVATRAAFFKYLWITIAAINIELDDHMTFPYWDDNALLTLEQRFAERWGRGTSYHYRGCVGAIDGLVVRCMKPSRNQHAAPQSFFCGRYKCFGLAFQVIVDADCKFMWSYGNAPGSVHDSTAFKMSSLHAELQAGKMNNAFHLAGDGAYTDEEFLLTPWPEPRNGKLAADKEAFNWGHSTHRQNVERAFGMLVGRWLVLEGTMRVPYSRIPSVVQACMKLQNVCIERAQAAPLDDGQRTGDGAPSRMYRSAKPVVSLTSTPADRTFSGQRGQARTVKRAALTDALRLAGIEKPQQARMRLQNARAQQ